MRNIFIAILAFSTSPLIAQLPGSGGKRANGQQISGRLYGKIIESASGKAVEFASVQLLQGKMDSLDILPGT